MVALKVGRQGNSLGVTLTKEASVRLHVAAGDTLYLTDAPGGYRVTAYDPNFAHQMSVAENVMKRRRNALRELAKR
jgi:putative addiction module antidote